jgi:hypothetical protein
MPPVTFSDQDPKRFFCGLFWGFDDFAALMSSNQLRTTQQTHRNKPGFKHLNPRKMNHRSVPVYGSVRDPCKGDRQLVWPIVTQMTLSCHPMKR